MDRNYNQKNKDSLDQLELTSILTRTRDGISELTSALETMERMMDTVRDITTKTDLLALNASIEAARAGQAGKGFSVVADEVARLSEKSQGSILEIANALGSFRDQIDSIRLEVNSGFDMLQKIANNERHNSRKPTAA
jgi:methyl-accepting chemotaxis protein